MARYQEQWESYRDDTVTGIKDTEEGWSIPLAPGNRHYQAYQEWVGLGNTPDPAYTFAERQTMAIAGLGGILAEKLQQPVTYDGDEIQADKPAKDDITFRVYAQSNKNKDIKIKKTNGRLKTVAKNDITAMMEAIADRDDALVDAYETAITAIEAATDWAGVETAIAAFEAA